MRLYAKAFTGCAIEAYKVAVLRFRVNRVGIFRIDQLAEAVTALGLLGDRRGLPALEAVVRNADGFFLENVRKSAAEAIARINRA